MKIKYMALNQHLSMTENEMGWTDLKLKLGRKKPSRAKCYINFGNE